MLIARLTAWDRSPILARWRRLTGLAACSVARAYNPLARGGVSTTIARRWGPLSRGGCAGCPARRSGGLCLMTAYGNVSDAEAMRLPCERFAWEAQAPAPEPATAKPARPDELVA